MADRGSIRVTVVGTTDVGQVREHNEDNLLVADLTAGERLASGEAAKRDLGDRGFLLAVADGMGGAASGELASEMAVDSLHEAVLEKEIVEGGASPEDLSALLQACLNVANERIYARSQEEVEHRGMGTTMTAALLLGDTITIAQVGDSRAYLMRKGKLVQITKDQSLISQLIEDGTLTEEEAERLGGRNIILQALGVEPIVEVQSRAMEVLAGDVLVLCSDGLSGMVKDSVIEEEVADAEDLGATCARLVRLANEAGGRDNITVVLARFEGPGLRQPLSPLEAEEAGDQTKTTGFAAPAAPVVKRSLTKPAFGIGALAVLAVVVFLFALGGDVDVVFEFPAPGADAVLIGADGETINVLLAPGESRCEVRGLDPGTYRLVARLHNYEPLEKSVEITSKTTSLEVGLRALPGQLTLLPGTPKVRVEIRKIDRRKWEPAYSQVVEFGWSESHVLESVEAGNLRMEVSRQGFRPGRLDFVLPPAGEEIVNLPVLEPVTGTLELVDCPVAGARVKVTDGDGITIYEGVVPGPGALVAEVRVGSHSLEISHPSYEPFRTSIEVAEGESSVVDRVELTPRRGDIRVVCPVEATISLLAPDQPDVPVDVVRIKEGGGEYTFRSHPPGEYIVQMTSGGKVETRSVRLGPGGTETADFSR